MPDPEPTHEQSLGSCHGRERAHLHGTISSVTVAPKGSKGWLEAELSDGTGLVTLVWMGRPSIEGIHPGRRLHVRGRICEVKGRLVIYNPEYSLLG